MIHIELGVLNAIFVTIKELRDNTADFYYLLSLKNDTTDEVVNHKVNLYQEDDRITEIRFTEGTGVGQVDLKYAGHWHYTIYEDTSGLNTDPAAASIVKVLETGKALVTGAGSDAVTYTQRPQSTTNNVYIKI
jgi:hypothetical protein